MKAPDTIYIPIIEEEGKKLLCTNWWETDTSSRNAYVNETIPYIRKDALLGWAKAKHMELDPPQNERDFGRIEAVEELIKHIESL